MKTNTNISEAGKLRWAALAVTIELLFLLGQRISFHAIPWEWRALFHSGAVLALLLWISQPPGKNRLLCLILITISFFAFLPDKTLGLATTLWLRETWFLWIAAAYILIPLSLAGLWIQATQLNTSFSKQQAAMLAGWFYFYFIQLLLIRTSMETYSPHYLLHLFAIFGSGIFWGAATLLSLLQQRKPDYA